MRFNCFCWHRQIGLQCEMQRCKIQELDENMRKRRSLSLTRSLYIKYVLFGEECANGSLSHCLCIVYHAYQYTHMAYEERTCWDMITTAFSVSTWMFNSILHTVLESPLAFNATAKWLHPAKCIKHKVQNCSETSFNNKSFSPDRYVNMYCTQC